MKKILVIISIIALPALANAQIRFPKTINLELAAGVNDFPAFMPMGGLTFVWNDWLNSGLRYSYMRTEVDGCGVVENNVEAVAGFTAYSLKDVIFFNGNVGVVGKTQKIEDIPTPTFEPKPFNFGVVGEVEVEYTFQTYFSAFVRGGVRYCFLDEKSRVEGVYMAGLRVNSRIFKAIVKRNL